MAVGYVASATSGSQASVASFNIGTLGTGARAGIVFVCTHGSGDIITGVTWNSVAMTRLYRAADTDTEPGSVVAYFLDNVSNGVITVSRTNNATVTVGYAASISASRICEVAQTITRVSSTQNTNADTSTTGTGASGEVAVDDGPSTSNSMRFAAAYTGAATPVAAGTNSTSLQSLDSTAFGSSFVRETTAGQGSRNVGFATGTTDDWALVAVAVREATSLITLGLLDGGATLYAPTVSPDQFLTLPLLSTNEQVGAYSAEVLADTPTVYLKLDDPTGTTAVDSSGNGHDGTISGTMSLDQTGPMTGSKSMLFNGGQVLITDHADLDVGDGPWSFEVWFKRADNTVNRYILGKTDSSLSVPGYAIETRSGTPDTVRMQDGSTSTHINNTNDVVDNTNWHHLVVTRALATNAKMYIDGAAMTLSTTAKTFSDNNFDLALGQMYAGQTTVFGNLSRFAIYKSELSGARVTAHYDAATTGDASSPGGAILYAPTLAPKNTITLGLLDGAAALYAPTVSQAAGTQTITLGLLDEGAALYAPTLTPKNAITLDTLLDGSAALYAPTLAAKYALTPPLLDGAAALYAPTVIPGPVGVTLGLLDGAATLYAPTLVAKNAITLGLLDATATVYAPTLSLAPYPITLSLLDGGAALYAPTVVQLGGTQTIDLAFLDGASALYAPTIYPDQFVDLPLLDGAATTYAPTLTAKNTLTVPLLDGSAALYAPTIIPDQFVTLALLDAGAALYAPALAATYTLTPPLLDGGSALYAPTIYPDQFIVLGLLDGGAALYDPVVAQQGGPQTVIAPLLDGSATVYAPTVTPAPWPVTLGLIDGSATVYAPTISTKNTIIVPQIDGAAALYAPSVTPQWQVTTPLLDGGAATYAPVISPGAVTIGLALLDGDGSLYAPVIAFAGRQRGATTARSTTTGARARGSTAVRTRA